MKKPELCWWVRGILALAALSPFGVACATAESDEGEVSSSAYTTGSATGSASAPSCPSATPNTLFEGDAWTCSPSPSPSASGSASAGVRTQAVRLKMPPPNHSSGSRPSLAACRAACQKEPTSELSIFGLELCTSKKKMCEQACTLFTQYTCDAVYRHCSCLAEGGQKRALETCLVAYNAACAGQ